MILHPALIASLLVASTRPIENLCGHVKSIPSLVKHEARRDAQRALIPALSGGNVGF
jgi:hypothetical protein